MACGIVNHILLEISFPRLLEYHRFFCCLTWTFVLMVIYHPLFFNFKGWMSQDSVLVLYLHFLGVSSSPMA